MRKSLIALLLLATIPLLGAGGCPQQAQTRLEAPLWSYPQDLQRAVRSILAHPRAVAVLREVERDGGVSVRLASRNMQGFEAYWDPGSRCIVVDASRARNQGSLIRSILFELHNASTNSHLSSLRVQARSGRLSKEAYVEAVERMEYDNVCQVAALLKDGIAKGLYPPDATYPVFHRFDEHYRLQQLMGHSGFIARSYDRITPRGRHQQYRGPLGDISRLSRSERQQLIDYIVLANDLASLDPQCCGHSRSQLERMCNRWSERDRRWDLLERALGSDRVSHFAMQKNHSFSRRARIS